MHSVLLDQPQTLARFYQDELLQNVLPFWLRYGWDRTHGGILTCLDRDGVLLDSDKGVWQQGRFAWMLARVLTSSIGTLVGIPNDCFEAMQSTIRFIERFGSDPNDGRMWFHLERDGTPIRKRRYAFSESFASIAFARYAKLAQSEMHGRESIRLYKQFLTVGANPQPPKCTSARQASSLSFPMIALVTAQELRASLEPQFLQEYEVDIQDDIRSCVELILNSFVREDLQCVLEMVGPNGEVIDHFDGRLLNPGHSIEAAWFVMWEGYQQHRPEWISRGSEILDWMFHRGWDQTYGGLFNFVDLAGKPPTEISHDMKYWWPHNELILASLLAFQLTGERRYAVMHDQAHRWAFDHFADPTHGEWFGYLHRDGRLSTSLKGNLWKGCFHLPRMLLQAAEFLALPSRSN